MKALPLELRQQAHERMVVESGKLTHPLDIGRFGEPLRVEGPRR